VLQRKVGLCNSNQVFVEYGTRYDTSCLAPDVRFAGGLTRCLPVLA